MMAIVRFDMGKIPNDNLCMHWAYFMEQAERIKEPAVVEFVRTTANCLGEEMVDRGIYSEQAYQTLVEQTRTMLTEKHSLKSPERQWPSPGWFKGFHEWLDRVQVNP